MVKPKAPAETEQTREHYFELVGHFDTAMLVTRPPDGRLHGRPLSVAGRDDDGTLWFVTSEKSPKVAEVLADARALVSMQSSNRWLVIEGSAAIVRDRAKIEQLFTLGQKLWFEDENDPDIVLVRFTPDVAEYWDNAGALGIRFAFEAIKALARGRPLEDRGDERAHGKVVL
jgi:general stress protein 26